MGTQPDGKGQREGQQQKERTTPGPGAQHRRDRHHRRHRRAEDHHRRQLALATRTPQLAGADGEQDQRRRQGELHGLGEVVLVDEGSVGAPTAGVVAHEKHLFRGAGLARQPEDRDHDPGGGDEGEKHRQSAPGHPDPRRRHRDPDHDHRRSGDLDGRPRGQRQRVPARGHHIGESGLDQSSKNLGQGRELNQDQSGDDESGEPVQVRHIRHPFEIEHEQEHDSGRREPDRWIDSGERHGIPEKNDAEGQPVQRDHPGPGKRDAHRRP